MNLDAAELEARLAAFRTLNPESTIEARENSIRILKPWGDPTIALRIASAADPVVDDLNVLRLPPRYTAIWHTDTRAMEFIYTVAPVPEEHRRRSFVFVFEDREYRCEFADASDRLLRVAAAAQFVRAPGPSAHRNLTGFHHFALERMSSPEKVRNLRPTCFWVHGLDWDDDAIRKIAPVLNFHMHYYDRESPLVVIHDARPEEQLQPALQPLGGFPERIVARPIDEFLLGLWMSSVGAGPRLAFLYNYMIIEYAAFYYLRDALLRAVRKVLLSPEVQARPSESARRIIDAVEGTRISDDEKIRSLIQQVVDPLALWREIEPNRRSFENETVFEGGFTLQPLMKAGCRDEDFVASHFKSFPDQLRFIRNALVHGREPRISGAIAPTPANDAKLVPWIGPVTITAMQVVLYQDV